MSTASTVEKNSLYRKTRKGNVTIVTIRHKESFNRQFLLSSDRHWDNPHSKHDLQIKHLDQAIERKAGIIDLGDLFCAMQGKYDPRANKQGCRPEHQVDNYLDALVDTASEFFAPYTRNIIQMSSGNHETSVLKRCETNLTARLVNSLNVSTGSNIYVGGYSGWVIFRFAGPDRVRTKKLWYIHGYGGGGAVTRGVLETGRRAAYLPDADVIVSGHIHESWLMSISRIRLREDGFLYQDEQSHICLPTYKEEYGEGQGGFHIEKGRPPKPLGAAWLTFSKERGSEHIDTVITRAD